jgi:RNA polymerase sigma factor (sigma-70 family)
MPTRSPTPLLFAIVYNMLGTVADTEDVLQETWLSWAAAHHDQVDNPRAFLVRIAVNQALARRTALTRRRETYVGQWLPEPMVTDPVTSTESSSMALLVVLETLSPTERAVFVLHEAFGYPHTEIADMLNRTPEAVRQLTAPENTYARGVPATGWTPGPNSRRPSASWPPRWAETSKHCWRSSPRT